MMLGVMFARLNESAIALAVSPRTEARAAVRMKPVTLLMPVPRFITEAPRAKDASLSRGFGPFGSWPFFRCLLEVPSLMLPYLSPGGELDPPDPSDQGKQTRHHHDRERVEPAGQHGEVDLPEDEVLRLEPGLEADSAFLLHDHRYLKEVLLRLDPDLLVRALGEAEPFDLAVPLVPDGALADPDFVDQGSEQRVLRHHHPREALQPVARPPHLCEILILGDLRLGDDQRVVVERRDAHHALAQGRVLQPGSAGDRLDDLVHDFP